MKNKTKLYKWPIVVALMIGLPSLAQATTVFQDDFNSYAPLGSNFTGFGTNWTVSSGSVDLLGPTYGDYLAGQGLGNYIDLDGTTEHAGTLTTVGFFGPGTYTLSFDLAGSQRTGSDTVTVKLGDHIQNYTVNFDALLSNYAATFTITTGGNLSFQNSGDIPSDNIGALLDNVLLTKEDSSSAVPEPATLFLLGTGLAGIAGVIRKKKA